MRTDVARERRVPRGFGVVDPAARQFDETDADSPCLAWFETDTRVVETSHPTHPHHSVPINADVSYVRVDDCAESAEGGVKRWAHPRIMMLWQPHKGFDVSSVHNPFGIPTGEKRVEKV